MGSLRRGEGGSDGVIWGDSCPSLSPPRGVNGGGVTTVGGDDSVSEPSCGIDGKDREISGAGAD